MKRSLLLLFFFSKRINDTISAVQYEVSFSLTIIYRINMILLWFLFGIFVRTFFFLYINKNLNDFAVRPTVNTKSYLRDFQSNRLAVVTIQYNIEYNINNMFTCENGVCLWIDSTRYSARGEARDQTNLYATDCAHNVFLMSST